MFADAPIDVQSIKLTVMELFSREPRFTGSRSPFKTVNTQNLERRNKFRSAKFRILYDRAESIYYEKKGKLELKNLSCSTNGTVDS